MDNRRELIIVTDTWEPQVNGVVRTLANLTRELLAIGVNVTLITPQDYRTLPLPTYPEIRLSLVTRHRLGLRLAEHLAAHVHIATEGPLGIAARSACIVAGRRFTTCYHTRFPEYLRARLPVPESWSYRWLRHFHGAARATLVATRSLQDELAARGFKNLRLWGRGVDTALFHPSRRKETALAKPVFLYVGRVAVEKNLPAFLELDLPGTKLVVGSGPDLERLRTAYPDAVFTGSLEGRRLAEAYASSDVFVFPSRTDTFGLVLLEALASGVPVAALPVTGPLDIFSDGVGGVLSDDLRLAALAALSIPQSDARQKAMDYSWAACARRFTELAMDDPILSEAA